MNSNPNGIVTPGTFPGKTTFSGIWYDYTAPILLSLLNSANKRDYLARLDFTVPVCQRLLSSEPHEERNPTNTIISRFVFSTSCTKSSILLLYKRVIQGTVNAKFILIVKTAIGSIFVYFFVFFFLMIFQCKPTESFWKQFSLMDPYTEDFHCIPESHVPMANAAVSVLTDFVSACLPIFLFVQVHLPIRQKISLGILFAVGFV